MALTFDGVNTNSVTLDGVPINTLNFDGQRVWERDEQTTSHIFLSEKPVASDEAYGFRSNLSAGNNYGDLTPVTIDGFEVVRLSCSVNDGTDGLFLYFAGDALPFDEIEMIYDGDSYIFTQQPTSYTNPSSVLSDLLRSSDSQTLNIDLREYVEQPDQPEYLLTIEGEIGSVNNIWGYLSDYGGAAGGDLNPNTKDGTMLHRVSTTGSDQDTYILWEDGRESGSMIVSFPDEDITVDVPYEGQDGNGYAIYRTGFIDEFAQVLLDGDGRSIRIDLTHSSEFGSHILGIGQNGTVYGFHPSGAGSLTPEDAFGQRIDRLSTSSNEFSMQIRWDGARPTDNDIRLILEGEGIETILTARDDISGQGYHKNDDPNDPFGTFLNQNVGLNVGITIEEVEPPALPEGFHNMTIGDGNDGEVYGFRDYDDITYGEMVPRKILNDFDANLVRISTHQENPQTYLLMMNDAGERIAPWADVYITIFGEVWHFLEAVNETFSCRDPLLSEQMRDIANRDQTFEIYVDVGQGGGEGDAPVITQQPVDTAYAEGTTVTLFSSGDNYDSIEWWWRHPDAGIPNFEHDASFDNLENITTNTYGSWHDKLEWQVRYINQHATVVSETAVVYMGELPPDGGGEPLPPADFTFPLYSPDSLWNQLIPDNPEIDPDNAEMIASLVAASNNGVDPNFNHRTWTVPVYMANASTPRYDVPITHVNSAVWSSMDNVPIPLHAEPSGGDDGHMCIIDVDTGFEWNFWRIERSGNGWTCANAVGRASVDNSTGDASHDGFFKGGNSATATGFTLAGGIVFPEEINDGNEIEHALQFAYPSHRATNDPRGHYFAPATNADAFESTPTAIPQGALLQLNPNLNPDDYNLRPYERKLFVAMQRYGMYNGDFSGGISLYGVSKDCYPSDPYDADLGLSGNWATLFNIPWSEFRVLKLPDFEAVTWFTENEHLYTPA